MKAFSNQKYKKLQKQEILKRISAFSKLYIEVGGKLFDDNHASRVLPGFEPDVKMQIFSEFKDDLQIIFCVNAEQIIEGKTRGDNSFTYADETLRLVNEMRKIGMQANDVMINFYQDNPMVHEFEAKCEQNEIKTYKSYRINNYPNNVNLIVSDEGFGKNDYIKTTKNLVLVAAPGANSGKLQTCLSQLYLDKQNGIEAGYAKYETFPVWNLPLNHLVNLAYEMATVDLKDKNKIDPYFLKAHKQKVVNYNRDIESYPVLNETLTKIMGKQVYDSPTSMGVNNVGNAIVDDFAVQQASMEEIERRHLKHKKLLDAGKISKASFALSARILKKATKIFKKLQKSQQKQLKK